MRGRLTGLIIVTAVLTTACGGTYHPETPDQARLVEVLADSGAQAAGRGDEGSSDTGGSDRTPTATSTPGDTATTGGQAPDGDPDGAGTSQAAPPSGEGGTSNESDASTDVGTAGRGDDLGGEDEDPNGQAGFPVADVGADRPADAGGTITLGIVGPHTGPIAGQGLASLRGVQAVIAEYNANGGIHGTQIELLVEDDQFDPVQGRRFAQRMINQDQIFAMMGLLTPATFAQSLPDFEASGTLMMIGDGAASTGGSRLVFPSYQECPTAQRAVGQHAVENLGFTKVAILEIDIEISRTCADAGVDTIERVGGQVVYRAGVTPGGIGCDSQVQGVMDSGAETVIMQAETLTFIRCIQALRQQGSQIPVGLSANGVDDDALIDALGAQAEGIYSTSGFQPKWHPTTRSQCTDVIDTYYPDSGATQYLGYAACIGTRILLDALTVLGPDATAREVIGYLESATYDTGGMGPPITYSPDDHEPYTDLFVMEIRDGRWEPITERFTAVGVS